MTTPEHSRSTLPALTTAIQGAIRPVITRLPQGWGRSALLLAGGLVVIEAIGQITPFDGGGLVTVGILGGGWWALSRRRTATQPRLPDNVAGWIERCEGLLRQFERLGQGTSTDQEERRLALEMLRSDRHRADLQLAFVSSRPPEIGLLPSFRDALRGLRGLTLHWGHSLPSTSADWQWPLGFERCDLFLYGLDLPLRALDLRWLEALPAGLPVWLLIRSEAEVDRHDLVTELVSQWPEAVAARLLFWDGSPGQLAGSLAPLTTWLDLEAGRLRAATPLRCLAGLHRQWQADLERLRRLEWQRLQQRTQWLVAAAVVAAPLPSLDLLVLAVANGMMLKEMAQLWDCPWSPEQLRCAALELARASLAMGVVEWSSQALAGAVKLHGATWLVGGALQAFSAAYLTRVVGHAMADMLALSAGVAEPDLEVIKRQAPLLVGRAAEAEKLNWGGFLEQGRNWLALQDRSVLLNTAS